MRKLLLGLFAAWMGLSQVVTANILTNGSFEAPATLDFVDTGWTATGPMERPEWSARTGLRGTRFPGWEGASTASLYQNVTANQTGEYTFSVWVYREQNYLSTNILLSLEWLDASGNPLGDAPAIKNIAHYPKDSLWRHAYVSGTCTNSNLGQVRVKMNSTWTVFGGGSSSFLIDDASLLRGAFTGTTVTNQSFESGTQNDWRNSQWKSSKELTGFGSGGERKQDWARRSGNFGVGLYSWDNSATNYSITLQQNVAPYPSTGLYTFAVWIRREANGILTNAEIAIQLYDETRTNLVQAVTNKQTAIPADGVWKEYFVTTTNMDPSVVEARVVMKYDWTFNTNNVDIRSSMFDDARLLRSEYSTEDCLPDWAYHSARYQFPRWEQVPGGNVGSFQQVNYTTWTSTWYVLTESPTFARRSAPDGEVSEMRMHTSWNHPGSDKWIDQEGIMSKVGSVVLDSATPFHGMPVSGTHTVDLWRYEWSLPRSTNDGSAFSSTPISIFYAPYMVSKNGEAVSPPYYLVAQPNAVTNQNNLGQLFDVNNIAIDYQFVSAPDIYPALTNGNFEQPDAGTMDNSGWFKWGSLGRETWAAHSGTWGGAFFAWDTSDAGVFQYVQASPGTYTFSIWFRRELNTLPEEINLVLEWNSPTGVVQVNHQYMNSIPNDAAWRLLHITATCNDPSVTHIRPMLTSRYLSGPGVTSRSMAFDDADLYSGGFTGVQPLANAGFEQGDGLAPAAWVCQSNLTDISRETWAFHSETWGAVFKGWETNQLEYSASLYQPLVAPTGSYVLAFWMKRESAGILLTNLEVRMDWYDQTYTNRLVSTVQKLNPPSDNTWYQYSITSECLNVTARELRPVIFAQWERNMSPGIQRTVQLDDFTLIYTNAASEYTDGIPNTWWDRYSIAPEDRIAADDLDSDTASNWEEFVADTDPTLDSSFYPNQIATMSGVGTMILLAGPPTTNSRNYTVYWKTNLMEHSWVPYGVLVQGAANGTAVQLTVTNAVGQRFYRTGVALP